MFDRSIEKEFDAAIDAFPEDKRTLIHKDKLKASRIWMIFMMFVTVFLQLTEHSSGMVS